MGKVLAVDLGGTKLAVGIVDEGGRILASASAPTRRGSPGEVIAQAKELAQEIGAEAANPRSMGLSLPGVLDPTGQILLDSPSSGWKEVPFTRLFSDAFGLSAFADNDAKACALAESVFGGAKNLGSFFWMTISTGIGGAFFANGKVLRGARGMAGEIGHLVVRPGGARCTCGNCGCLEAEASGTAWAKKARALDPSWRGDAEALAADARAGRPLGLAVVKDVSGALARGIGALVDLLDPEAVFLGGGVAEAADLLVPRIEAELPTYTLAAGAKPVILKSSLGRGAGLIGAACLALCAPACGEDCAPWAS